MFALVLACGEFAGFSDELLWGVIILGVFMGVFSLATYFFYMRGT